MNKNILITLFLCILSQEILLPTAKAQSTGTTTPSAGAQKIDINKVQQKYLVNAGNEVQVVQNRTYTKAHKFELGLLGGFVSADPFLNIYSYGGFLGYHFSEYVGIRALYWKDNASKTASWSKSGLQSGQYINTNAPTSLMGAEIKYTPIYGKVSISGSSIVYYDLSLFAGAGVRKTQSGSSMTPLFGIGQQFYFSKHFSFGVDYRLMKYSENIIDQQASSATLGQVVDKRSDFSSILFFSLSCLI